jgi:hypothetical protein
MPVGSKPVNCFKKETEQRSSLLSVKRLRNVDLHAACKTSMEYWRPAYENPDAFLRQASNYLKKTDIEQPSSRLPVRWLRNDDLLAACKTNMDISGPHSNFLMPTFSKPANCVKKNRHRGAILAAVRQVVTRRLACRL